MNNILEIQNLTKHFGNKTALDQVNFHIQKGHIVGLVGPNGAGKTTIMRAILGMVKCDHGQVKIDGDLITPINHPKLQQVGALIDYPGIYPYMTGYEQLKLYATGPDAEEKISQIVTELDMDSYIDKKTKAYSLAMKQKLGIAMALVNRAKFLVLDEPLNGLDSKASQNLQKLLKELAASGTTILISSHNLRELQNLVDDVIMIDQGKVVSAAPITEIAPEKIHSFVLETSDDMNARDLLEENNYPIEDQQQLIISSAEPTILAKTLRFLIESGIDVYSVDKNKEPAENFFECSNRQ